jgi:outer membrane protein X
MTKLLQKLTIVTITITMSMTAFAQKKGDVAAGAHLVLGTGKNSGVGLTNFGIGAKFQYNVTDPIRLEGSFTYFLEKDFWKMWDFSANGHYLFPVTGQVTVYPLAGMGIFGTNVDYGLGSSTASDVCFNLGCGADFKLTDQWVLNVELKYKFVNNWNRLLISAGVVYQF